MKVTDAEILQAIWRQQVIRTASGVITNYVGNHKGLCSKDSQWFAQMQYMISRAVLGLPLSKGHLGRRLKALIGEDGLEWHGRPGNGYRFVGARTDEVFETAINWWSEQGVPGGYDADAKCMRTVFVDQFDEKVVELERYLLNRFGESKP